MRGSGEVEESVEGERERPSQGHGIVAINGRAAMRTEIGGVERLAREMADRLPALRPDRYRVIRPPAALAHRAGHLWEQALLPLAAQGAKLLYSPANLGPVLDRRNVLVIHDLAALRRPQAYSRTYVAYQRRVLPRLAAAARLLITVSSFSKAELVELLGIAPERITVIPDGVGEGFTPAAEPEPARAALALRDPYVLVVGTSSERKNLNALRRTSDALRRQGAELVLAGSQRSYLRGENGPLRRLGYVPEELLPGLYAGALALVNPSLYEGFGLPCLEAMACGVPVVAARAGALPETVGDAGVLVDPGNPEAICEAVLRVAGEPATRTRLIAAGLERARAFTWQNTARLTDCALGQLLGGG